MVTIDFSRTPTPKERLSLEARRHRLDQPDYVQQVQQVYEVMPGKLTPSALVIRSAFSYRAKGANIDASDRKAPPREERPPATRLRTSRGAALRFGITLIALAQKNRKPGAKARLSRLDIDIAGSASELGWADLLASDAVNSNSGGVFITARNKRARSVRSALEALRDAGLVDIPGKPGDRNRFEDFVLLNEGGVGAVGEAEEYTVPGKAERTFTVPSGFVSNGWLHLLEDSEIALLLMVASGRGGWAQGGLLAMPAETRLRHYGMHRDGYSSARKTLEWFGLLQVEEVGRHSDGRAEEGDLRLHRLGLKADGFDRPAVDTLRQALDKQLSRS
ncbi:hypothetical protein ES689_14205 [Frigoribacterium sp. ACAM 257]|uniref:hypothetical protein n=1 Tax=Frigoribacterium sp. ACAM 257 TaxID=2508998 RepID=UPI0011BA1581|nr:hypothetical protein [Frigoribacterium sp. ACAM 257]TWX34991.1 hypothetical protein ES689_14205 [Frigoribacterium sp. ACAM 257]